MNRSDLQGVSRLRVKEARLLLDNGYFSGAYYLLGYAIECALKACIAKQIKRHDFPDRKVVNGSYTHDLQTLLGISGLKEKLQEEIQSNPTLEVNWTIVKDWKVESRYSTIMSETKARDFYSAVTARKNGVLTWLKKWW
jgi:HEPN domain-containing protein